MGNLIDNTSKKNYKSEFILNVRIDFDMTIDDVIKNVQKMVESKKNYLICTTNAEFIVDAQKDDEFKSIINNSSLSIPDGVGVLISRYYLNKIKNIKSAFKKLLIGLSIGSTFPFINYKIGQKISGVDLTIKLLDLANKKGYTVFFLGGQATNYFGDKIYPQPYDIAKKASQNMQKMYSNIKIIGASSEFSRESCDDKKTIDFIHSCMKLHNVSNIDLLFVAYNHKFQEKWIKRNSKLIPASVSIGVGGTLDYLSGFLKRPKSTKFEWFKKLIYRPFKFNRIFKAFPLFPILVFIDSIRKN